jgi:hypothetical protein
VIRNPFSRLMAIAASVGAFYSYIRVDRDAYAMHVHGRGARKSSGGRGLKRVNSPEYQAWKKAFGGLAVPAFTGLSRVRNLEAR